MPIRTALIGTGSVAQHHVAAAEATNGLQIVAICGRDETKAQEIAEVYSPKSQVMSVAEALHSKDIDAFIIAVPPHEQPDIAIRAFSSAKHVLCEKPLASNLGDAKRIEKAWIDSGKVGMVNFCYRLIPEIEAFKSYLHTADPGSINLVRVDWILSSRLDPSLSYMWKADAESGGGVLQNYGSQVIDYLFYDVSELEVMAAGQKVLFPFRPGPDGQEVSITGDEVVTVMFNVREAFPVLMHLSLVTSPAVGHKLTAYGSKGFMRISNSGDNQPGGPFSVIETDGIKRVINEKAVPEKNSTEDYKLASLFHRVLDRFAKAVSSQSNSYAPNISAGVRVAGVIQEIREVSQSFLLDRNGI